MKMSECATLTLPPKVVLKGLIHVPIGGGGGQQLHNHVY